MGLTGALLYMVLLGFGAIITPGVGPAGSFLALFPQPVTEYSHLPAYGFLTWLLTSALRERGWPREMALSVGVIAPMLFGVWMEILQAFVPGRVVDLGDVAFNAMGIGVTALLIGTFPEMCAYPRALKCLRFKK
jgi:VanZ family protein